MKTRRLGKTGIEVSEIGFGSWGIGGSHGDSVAYGPTDDAVSRAALREARETGINFFDTSPVYGYGRGETLIGEVFEGAREKVALATKVGFVHSSGAQDFSPAHLEESLEGSLKRLRTDRVDLYQVHDPPMALLEREPAVMETLRSLKEQGKVRALGITVRSPEEAFQAVERFGFECVQINFNLLDQRVLQNGLLDFCGSRGVGVIVRTPLCFGFLTGAYAAEGPFDPADHRSRWSLEQRALWVEGYRIFQSVLSDERQTPAQLALRFCLSHPAVSTVIPGIMRPEHALEDVVASEMGPLAPAQMDRLRRIYEGQRFFIKDRLVLSE